jgi:hypothetical protein
MSGTQGPPWNSIMIERRIYHVRRSTDDFWEVIKEGFNRPHIVRKNKEEAVLMAKRLAKIGSPGQVVIHGADDAVETRFHYDFPLNDPTS